MYSPFTCILFLIFLSLTYSKFYPKLHFQYLSKFDLRQNMKSVISLTFVCLFFHVCVIGEQNNKNDIHTSINTTHKTDITTLPTTPSLSNISFSNQTSEAQNVTNLDAHQKSLNYNFKPLIEGFSVLFAISLILLAFMGFRSLRIHRRSNFRHYGLLSTCEDVDMTPLGRGFEYDDEDEDEEDATVFDRSRHPNKTEGS